MAATKEKRSKGKAEKKKPPEPKVPLAIPDDLNRKRVLGAIRTLVGAVGALEQVRSRQAEGGHCAAPLASNKDKAQLARLVRVVKDIELLARQQREEAERVLQRQLREEVVEAFHKHRPELVGRADPPDIPPGVMMDWAFIPPSDATTEVKVRHRLQQAWAQYQFFTRTEPSELPKELLDHLSSETYLKDKRHRHFKAAATTATVLMLRPNQREKWFANDLDCKDAAVGRWLGQIARDGHYPRLEDGPVSGELGYFFGACWPVEEQVSAVASEAFGHIVSPPVQCADAGEQLPPPEVHGDEFDGVIVQRVPSLEGKTLNEIFEQLDLPPDARAMATGFAALMPDDDKKHD